MIQTAVLIFSLMRLTSQRDLLRFSHALFSIWTFLKYLIRVPHRMLIRAHGGHFQQEGEGHSRERRLYRSADNRPAPLLLLEVARSINRLLFEGKTCLLYYILILYVIRAQPIVFRDIFGEVFFMKDELRRENGRVVIPGDDILTLVDADGDFGTPKPCLLDSGNLRVLLISLPGNRKHRRWLNQCVRDTDAVFVMEL